ncbi:hypothetical protein [Planctobacterium marinum]|uniref:hypothetical protein n=1 Tax=Planctobacterium marinum TaxID=1631968 RepID=UPI001E2AB8D8|nr:hypothetical protein [Planctobacterium marinum]MCC2605353.1 hypothetical protein [Planctobacterium marinum]
MELSQGHYLKQWLGNTLIIELIGELTVNGLKQYLEEIRAELSSDNQSVNFILDLSCFKGVVVSSCCNVEPISMQIRSTGVTSARKAIVGDKSKVVQIDITEFPGCSINNTEHFSDLSSALRWIQ